MYAASILTIICLGLVLASDIMLFTNYFVSRDHAQYCCDKSGMSLMKISNQGDSDSMEATLRSVPGLSGVWLGIFQDPDVTNSTQFVWGDRQTPTWNNWDDDMSALIGGNTTTNETLCIQAKLDTPSGLLWAEAPCTALMAYGCQVGLNKSTIVNPISSATCPKLVKLTGKTINRTLPAQRHALFDVEDQVSSMGSQVGLQVLGTSNHPNTDCAFHCLREAQCAEAIIIADQLLFFFPPIVKPP